MKKLLTIFLATFALALNAQQWTGTWGTAAEFTGPGDMPQKTTLDNTSVRQIVHVSLGGDCLRLQLSNEFSAQPVEIKSVYIADAKDTCEIDRKTTRMLRFEGQYNTTIQPGKTIWSDPIKYNLKPLQLLSITVCYGAQVPVNATSHRGSRTTSYIAKGTIKPGKAFNTFERVDHWYNITKIDVPANGRNAIAGLGNSITDGRGTTTNKHNRWTDIMAETLIPTNPAGVLNLGIGGNCVVAGGLSEPALKRFDRDILGQSNVETLIIFQGTNDIGTTGHAEQTVKKLIDAYQTLIDKAHAAGIKRVYGATITPFKGNGWYSVFHETARQVVNEWIRTSGKFDGVIDFDKLVRDPQDKEKIQKQYTDDWLHLNPEGYKVMGQYAAKIITGE
jgi:lysophospholipase L1-like esterase